MPDGGSDTWWTWAAGTQLSILPGFENETFPVNELFNISHGWGFSPPGGKVGFELMVVGVFREPDFVYRTVETNRGEGLSIAWLWAHNFPDGMTSTYTFVGEWFTSCKYAVKSGLYPEPRPKPNEKVVILSDTVEVDFLS